MKIDLPCYHEQRVVLVVTVDVLGAGLASILQGIENLVLRLAKEMIVSMCYLIRVRWPILIERPATRGMGGAGMTTVNSDGFDPSTMVR